MKTNGNFSGKASGQYEKMLREFRASSNMEAFGAIWRSVTGQVNSNIERVFAGFIQNAQTFSVSREVLSKFKREIGGHIMFWRAFGVVMITRRKKVHFFVAEDELLGMIRDRSILQDGMIKTRFGYVPNGGQMFNAGLHTQMNARHTSSPQGEIRH